MDLRAQFTQIQPVRALERELVLASSRKSGALSPRTLDLIRYALNVARLSMIRVGTRDLDVFELVAPFRHWLIEQLEYFVDPHDRQPPEWRGLQGLVAPIVERVAEVRTRILEHHAQDFDEDRLEREITRKELVVVLGGGGGSGYSHLGAFSMISEMGLTPSLIVGASMGALIGLFRAERKHYDPMAAAVALPRPSEFPRVFSPYRGFSRFGFPGTLELKARSIGTEIFANLIGRAIPTIRELGIPYRAVVTGLRTGIGLALSDIERQIERSTGRRSPIAIRRRASLFIDVVRLMLENPRFLEEVVFGGDEGLEDFHSIDAMGFSCAVPGLIHYDIYARANHSTETLRELFSQRQIFRLTDGGVVSNVPCRVAWNTVQEGSITYRNAFVLGFDAFAPVLNTNAIFLPIQQLVRRSVLMQRPWSDHIITYRQPPSPVKLLLSFDTLQQVITRTRTHMRADRPFIELMMRRLPRWSAIEPGIRLSVA